MTGETDIAREARRARHQRIKRKNARKNAPPPAAPLATAEARKALAGHLRARGAAPADDRVDLARAVFDATRAW